jgi:hypothetical protein
MYLVMNRRAPTYSSSVCRVSYAELIFANADIFRDDLLARVRAADPPPDTVGIRLIARARSRVRDALRRNGIVDVLGEDNLAPTVDSALEAIKGRRDVAPLTR